MPKTISKGRIYSCTVEVPDKILSAMKNAKDIAAQNVQKGAEYWHTKVLPEHFKTGAAGRYGYAQRAVSYLKDRRKAGKPSLVFSGSMRRDLTSRAGFKVGAGSSVDLKMSARVLNFAPRMNENDSNAYVKHKNGRGYPNLKREVKAILDEEREAIAQVIATGLQLAFDPQTRETAAVQAGLDSGNVGTMREAIEAFFD